jgi:hypothetical protein
MMNFGHQHVDGKCASNIGFIFSSQGINHIQISPSLWHLCPLFCQISHHHNQVINLVHTQTEATLFHIFPQFAFKNGFNSYPPTRSGKLWKQFFSLLVIKQLSFVTVEKADTFFLQWYIFVDKFVCHMRSCLSCHHGLNEELNIPGNGTKWSFAVFPTIALMGRANKCMWYAVKTKVGWLFYFVLFGISSSSFLKFVILRRSPFWLFETPPKNWWFSWKNQQGTGGFHKWPFQNW